MIQHLGNMLHALAAFGGTQQQIVVLGAVVARAEAANTLDQLASQHAEMAQVVDRKKVVGIEIGFEMRIDMAAIDIELVFIRIHDIRVAREDGLRDFEQCIAGQRVVVVEQADIVAAGKTQGRVGRTGDAGIGRQTHDLDALIELAKFIQCCPGFGQGRGVVGNAQFPMRIELLTHRIHRRQQPAPLDVVYRHQDRDAW